LANLTIVFNSFFLSSVQGKPEISIIHLVLAFRTIVPNQQKIPSQGV